MEAVISMVVSAFAIQRTWVYVRDPENERDLWWYTNAFVMALAILSIFVIGYNLRKASVVPLKPAPPIQAVPVVHVVPFAPPAPPAPAPLSVGEQARAATQKAVNLTQRAHLQGS